MGGNPTASIGWVPPISLVAPLALLDRYPVWWVYTVNRCTCPFAALEMTNLGRKRQLNMSWPWLPTRERLLKHGVLGESVLVLQYWIKDHIHFVKSLIYNLYSRHILTITFLNTFTPPPFTTFSPPRLNTTTTTSQHPRVCIVARRHASLHHVRTTQFLLLILFTAAGLFSRFPRRGLPRPGVGGNRPVAALPYPTGPQSHSHYCCWCWCWCCCCCYFRR